MTEIVKKIEELGYIVKLGRSTEVIEPFISLVTSKIERHSICFSTDENDIKFLKDCYKILKNEK